MPGRDITPFERSAVSEARPVDAFTRGIQRASIVSVDSKAGKCTIRFESTPGERTAVNIYLSYFSLPPTGNRRRAAWKRSMPSVGDIVLVGFDSNATPRILGYDIQGYHLLATLQAEEPFAYSPLEPGEFDEKSSGGAYIRGRVTGDLFLAGGLTSLQLSKNRYEIAGRTGLLRVQTGSSVFRVGNVKRSAIPFLPEEDAKPGVGVPPLPNPVTGVLPNLSEFTADIKANLPGLPLGLAVGFLSMGNVMDPDVDLITSGAYGAVGPLGIKRFKIAPAVTARYFMRIYDSLPGSDTPIGTPGPISGTLARPYDFGIDALGNTFTNLGLGAIMGWNLYSPLHTSVVASIQQYAGNIFLGLNPALPTLALAGPVPPLTRPEVIAGGPAICSVPFFAALSGLTGALATFAGVAAAGTAVTTPVEAVAYAKAIGAAAAPLSAAIAAFTAALPATVSDTVYVAKTGLPAVVPPTSAFFL